MRVLSLALVVMTCAAGAAAAMSVAPALDAWPAAVPAAPLVPLASLSPASIAEAVPTAAPDAPTPAAALAPPAALDASALLGVPLLPDGTTVLALPGDLELAAPGTLDISPAARAAPPAAAAAALPDARAPAHAMPLDVPVADPGSAVPAAPVAGPPSSSSSTQSAHVAPAPGAPPAGARTPAAIAAGSAAAGVLGLVGFALFHRVRPATALDNGTRKSIFDAVCETPGLGVHAIAQRTSVSYSTATYHLERLVAAGMIVMTPDGNKLCYYKNGGAFTEAERRILPILKNEEAARLFEAILESPGTYRAALAERLGVTATTINWHLKRLREADLVREDRQGRNAFLTPNVAALQRSLPGLAVKLAGSATDVIVADRIRRYVGYAGGGSATASS